MPRYATLNQLADHMQIDDTLDNGLLTLALAAAEEAVDDFCRRRFDPVNVQDGGAKTQRLYTPYSTMRVLIDDAAKVDAVEVRDHPSADYVAWDAERWAGTPLNAVADGRVFTAVESVLGHPFGRGLASVRVTAWFGWPAVPSAVEEATLLQAARLAKRREAPFGVSHVDLDGGGVRLLAKLDADVETLLQGDLQRRTVLVA